MPSRIPVQKIKLGNKAVILVEENHSTPIVSFCAYFLGGVRSEKERQNGIAYFTQKVILKGSEKFTAEESAFKIESIGGLLVPFTEKDSFGCHMSVLSKHFEPALDLFFDAMFHPTFPREEVEKERQVILAEIEEGRDEIYSHCLELCDKTMFSQHPYRFPIKGEPESVACLTREDLMAWHDQWYRPNNLVFCVVGDVSAERVAERMVKSIENLPKGKFAPLTPPHENGKGHRETVVELQKRQLALSIGFLAPDATEDERFSFEVLSGLLSGMGSRLFIELRDKQGLAYSLGSRYDPALDHGIFKVFMGTAAEREEAAKEGLLYELMRLRKTRTDEEELARTKRYMIGMYEIRRQKNSTQALRYARYEILGLGWRTANIYPRMIESVQADAVRAMAERYINPENYSCAVIRPAKTPSSAN